MPDATDFKELRSSYPVLVVAQHNADVPVLATYDPLNLPSSLTFSATGDGGVESPPLGDTGSAAWWRESGALALTPYSDEALTALRNVADAAGTASVGAALDVLTATQSVTALNFVYSHVATIWAQAAEGYTLLKDPETTCATMYDWGSRVTQYHDLTAKTVAEQSTLAVLNQTLPGGSTVYSALWKIPQLTEQAASFYLEMYVPGLAVKSADKIDVVVGGTGSDTIQTGAGCDAVLGFEGNDVVSTGDGCDRIWGGLGDNRLDGGQGVDTAMYPGTKDKYVIAATTDGFTVTRSDGVDTLTNIERLKFADASVALDAQGSGGEAYRLYRAAFDRDPDLPGLGYHMHALDGGLALEQVACNFLGSPEFQLKYGALDNAGFLSLLYANALHRAPDRAGLAFHMADLESGVSRATVLTHFSESPELQALLVGTVGQGMEYLEWLGAPNF